MGITRNQAVTLINSWIGKKESDGSHKSIIDIYNKQTSLPRNYKLQYTDSWCAGTITAVFQSFGAIDKIAPECSCGNMITGAKTMGIWEESDSYVPKIGDVIMYDWGDDGTGDCTGWPEHVGMVVEINGSTFKVVEGNKSDAVGTRTMSVNGKYIRGYVLPKYDDVEITESNDVDKEDVSEDVTTVIIAVDGEWGCYTTKRTQEVLGTTQDGLVSNQLTSCQKYLPNALTESWEFGSKTTGKYSPIVLALQTLVGLTDDDLDGWMGQTTVKALQTYLNSKNSAGLSVDGEMGIKTVKAWQTWLNKQ